MESRNDGERPGESQVLPLRVSRYIAEFLKQKGLSHVHGLQGGAVVHLFDACERFGPKPIYCHHEQGAAFAAGAYARVHGYGACIVTTGPGGTNAVTPCLGAWQNYTPMMFISGQVRYSQIPQDVYARAGGLQWAPTCELVSGIAKYRLAFEALEVPALIDELYADTIKNPSGPSWLDVCLDVQWQEV